MRWRHFNIKQSNSCKTSTDKNIANKTQKLGVDSMNNFPEPFYRWRPHPWHGLEPGTNPPEVVNSFIEITPFDSVKYEVDKTTGYILVDRPQNTSSLPPHLYGFIPRTYCGTRVAKLSPKSKKGDKDPLDICVISDRPISRGEVILRSKVIGGIQMIDHGEADDKIVSVLEHDNIWGEINDISELPKNLIERLRHYFATYKYVIGEKLEVDIEQMYGREHAFKVIEASLEDYIEGYGG